MKRTPLCSLIAGVSLVLAAIVVTGCNKMTDQQGTTSGFNIQSTGKADPALKGTRWSYNDEAATMIRTISFAADDRNVANVDYKEAIYTVKDKTVSFDYSQYIRLWKSMTVDRFIQLTIAETKKEIAEIENQLKAEKDAAKKKALEQRITRMKEILQYYQNVTQEQKNELAEDLTEQREMLTALEKYATFSGTLDGETITVEKFPVHKPGAWELKKIALKKDKINNQ